MKKAKSQYNARMMEYQKAKEASIKAEGDQLQHSLHSNTSSFLPTTSVSGKMEKRKKQEEDSISKV